MKQIRKRLTYANVMSSIAVFLVLGGATAIAAGLAKNSVGSKQLKKNAVTTAKIKNNAVTTSKIKNGAVTGAKVNVGSLGTVPNATHANSADSAGSANSAGNVNGQTIHKILFRTTSDVGTTGPVTVFNAGGLTISVTCTGGQATVQANTSKTDSSIYIDVFDSGSVEVSQEILESGEFDPSQTADLLAGNGGNNDLSLFEFDAVDGTVVTGLVNTDEDGALDGCRVTGHATVG
ncbi:MAG TPA: hypothetical protein VFY75_01375 [Solirubrobacterales bacterium]|nr:hypothetical protein [Solirubrobacterales bacterium]